MAAETSGVLTSSKRPTRRTLYLVFSIRDGGQKLGVTGDGYCPYAVTFWTAVKYGVHRDSEKKRDREGLMSDEVVV